MRLELRGLTKRFGSFVANDHIDLTVEPGEIHCLLGENGAGKSTLVNMLYGLLQPDDGTIVLDGEPVTCTSPGQAIASGIGMVHQHFMLVPVFTVAENVMLGREPTRGLGRLDRNAACDLVRDLSRRYGLDVDPDARVEDIPVGIQQRVEILKALAGDAQTLILDEPTAVLTPREIDELIEVMRALKAGGTSVVFITHKLKEVKAIADRITVIRRGRVVGTLGPEASEGELAELMVGRAVQLTVDKAPATASEPKLVVRGLHVVDPQGVAAVEDVSFDVRAGEILGIAGVQGNGQSELVEALVGLTGVAAGSVQLAGRELVGSSPRDHLEAGIGYIPEDRSHDGFVGSFSVAENLVLDLYRRRPFATRGTLSPQAVRSNADSPDRGVRRPYPVRRDARECALRWQPAEGRPRPRALPPAGAPDRRPADAWPRRRVDRVRPPPDRPRTRRGDRGPHRVDRARGDRGALRPDRGDVPRPARGDRRTRHPVGPAGTDDGRRSRRGGGPRGRGAPDRAGQSGRRVVSRRPSRRTDRPAWVRELVVSLAAVALALVVGAVLIVASDAEVAATWGYFFAYPPDALAASWTAVSDAYTALFLGALGGWKPITETLVQATPLICAGLGVSLAFRAGLFNIGAQGQLIAGAICAGWVGFTFDLPLGLHLLCAVAAGVVGGAVWGGIVGILKARTGAHEVILTIMLNYVALYLLQWLLTTDVLQRPGRDDPISPVVHQAAQYPQWAGTRLHLGFVVALAAAAAVWWLLARSTTGFELRAVGANPDAARTAGMSVGRAYTVAMVAAGALAGLAGTQQVLGTASPLTDGIAGTVGFDSITVALLGRASPFGTVVAGLVFGALDAGGLQMQLQTQTPLTLTTVLQATIVLFIAAPALVRAVFRIRGQGAGTVLAKGWNA